MNVKTPLFPPHRSKTKASASSASPAPTPTATVDSSGPSQHYWTVSQYLEISLPLTAAVIVLPLIAGPCFKFASQQYEAHRRHWRAFFVVLVACYFVGLIIMSCMRSNGWILLAYIGSCYPVLGMICVVRVVRSYRQKQGRLRWSLQLLTLPFVWMLDIGWFVDIGVPWSLVQYLSILLTSKMGIKWLKRRWTSLSWKTRRQSSVGYSSITTV
jgi:hypothetical protein